MIAEETLKDLETAITVEEAVVEDRDRGLGAGNEFSVKPDVRHKASSLPVASTVRVASSH